MLDRTIPFYNTILRCDVYVKHDVSLPKGFSIVPYFEGCEDGWARLESSIGDFSCFEEAKSYFVSTYLSDMEKCNSILFLLDSNKNVIGSCIAWEDCRLDAKVSSLHWLVVDEMYQGKGFGKALCISVMNLFLERSGYPIYIHTQPWSWKAIFLYLSVGFRIQKKDSFSNYENQYEQAMESLKSVLSEKQFLDIIELSEQ